MGSRPALALQTQMLALRMKGAGDAHPSVLASVTYHGALSFQNMHSWPTELVVPSAGLGLNMAGFLSLTTRTLTGTV